LFELTADIQTFEPILQCVSVSPDTLQLV